MSREREIAGVYGRVFLSSMIALFYDIIMRRVYACVIFIDGACWALNCDGSG